MFKLTLQGKNISSSYVDPDQNTNTVFFKDINLQLPQFDPSLEFEKSSYYTLSEFNKISNDTSILSFFHLNIASLSLHHTELTHLLENCNVKPDFIGITETRLSEKSEILSIQDYTHEDCLNESLKGGARLYISKKFSFLPRPDLTLYSKGELESVFVEIINHKKPNLIVGCIYRHPKMDIDKFNALYSNIVEKISFENKQIVLMGDFNIDLLNTTSCCS